MDYIEWSALFFGGVLGVMNKVYNYQNVCIYCILIDKCIYFLNLFAQFVVCVKLLSYLCNVFRCV